MNKFSFLQIRLLVLLCFLAGGNAHGAACRVTPEKPLDFGDIVGIPGAVITIDARSPDAIPKNTGGSGWAQVSGGHSGTLCYRAGSVGEQPLFTIPDTLTIQNGTGGTLTIKSINRYSSSVPSKSQDGREYVWSIGGVLVVPSNLSGVYQGNPTLTVTIDNP